MLYDYFIFMLDLVFFVENGNSAHVKRSVSADRRAVTADGPQPLCPLHRSHAEG